FVSTILTIPIALWFGWMLATQTFKIKPLIESMISLPLVVPPVVTGYLLLLLLGRNSAVGSTLFQLFGWQFTFNFAALVIASLVVSLPLAVRSIRSAFEMVDPAYTDVALTLGAPPRLAFFRITLPLALPGIVSGIVLSFARSLGEFGATITLAGNITGKTQTMALMIYSHMQVPESESQVTRLVIVSLLISILAMTASEWIARKHRGTHHAVIH
ncbi:MAG: molybdate ABC transporter permease subunit, partial [Deltaproteobacteria bacterium]|nr:molybdate ABC transporter permease subunit [Deltaproteobacteria bacterium]MBN2671412.1 molybdate ABC transporter permease subunit [Deltaproteobacteria bacterium]